MEITFSTKNQKQLDAVEYWIDDVTEEILYGGGKGGGKSFLGASLIFGDALIYPETHYFIARKELIDLRKFTIPTVHEVFKNWGLKIEDYAAFNGQDNVFNLRNGSKVYLIACNDVPSDPLFERFGSMQMTRGWLEEAGEIAENAKANLWLSIGRWKNKEYNLKKKLLITCNPKKGWMKRDFVDPWKQGLLPRSRQFVTALATDNPYLPEDYVETLRNEKDMVRKQRLFLGDWEYDEDQDSLVTFDALTDTFSNTIVKDGNKYLVIDVARLGKDSTVFTFWDGLELYKVEQFEKQDTQTTIQKAKDYASAEKIPFSHIIVDEDGIGGAVVDGMYGVKGFIANSTPLPTATEIRQRNTKLDTAFIPKRNFTNLKAQCAFKLAELINEHRIAFKVLDYRDILIEELTALLRQKNIDSDGKLQLRSKEDVKEDIGRSPDVGDTIIYRMWFELHKEATGNDAHRAVALERQNRQFIISRGHMVEDSTK
jgi:phage terminase large subunit